MGDPCEGLTAEGRIRTGASRTRVAPPYSAVVDEAVVRVRSVAPAASPYLYGSVATGVAFPPDSDVDLLTVDLRPAAADELARELSDRYSSLCRGVEVAAATSGDLAGDADEAHGMRVFVHHYCAHLAVPDLDRATAPFPGDRRAARGFNGDIARHVAAWRGELRDGEFDAPTRGRHVARKTLLAVAGLVSVHDSTWTTDRGLAAARWACLRPELAPGLEALGGWSDGSSFADRATLVEHSDTTVGAVAEQFAAGVGLWSD